MMQSHHLCQDKTLTNTKLHGNQLQRCFSQNQGRDYNRETAEHPKVIITEEYQVSNDP